MQTFQTRTSANTGPVIYSRIARTLSAASNVPVSPATKETVSIAKVRAYHSSPTLYRMLLFRSHVSADINECDNPAFAARCVENAECCNLPSNFLCKCKPGYIGDGEVHCEDVNECVIPGACGDNTVCDNIPGNYTCACQPGFTGDPYESVSTNFRYKVSFSKGLWNDE